MLSASDSQHLEGNLRPSLLGVVSNHDHAVTEDVKSCPASADFSFYSSLQSRQKVFRSPAAGSAQGKCYQESQLSGCLWDLATPTTQVLFTLRDLTGPVLGLCSKVSVGEGLQRWLL